MLIHSKTILVFLLALPLGYAQSYILKSWTAGRG